MILIPGDQAPNFNLYSTDKQPVTLTDYTGKNLLLLFFPMAFTGVCTTELCSMRDDIAAYNNAGVEVIAISVDSVFTLGKFKEEQKLNFPVLSDFNKEASEAYGVLYKEFVLGMRGVAKRSAFLIDTNGIIKYAEVLDNAGELPNFAAIKGALAELG
jgi:glutaredoxin-dependent peroxiredoxin